MMTTVVGKYNRLIHEKSPYLIQHADNPIWWYPWSENAFADARRENKPVFLSIGYSACYWCHFMEKDSFEKQDVADALNRDFISIKVDREERPDVDNIYMTALMSMTGQGGWPMSMFLTPEGKPFFGASTIRHDQLLPLLAQIAAHWQIHPDGIGEDARMITANLARLLNPAPDASDSGARPFLVFLDEMKAAFDERHAGFGSRTKFPRPHLLSALLRVHRRQGDPDSLRMTVRTLKAMARGGIHDLLAGGFHRYSVDPRWDVPHFEKMLYDNALLVVAYLEAHRVTGDLEFVRIARQTLDWTLAEMTHPDGGFYSAQDAGDFREEGDYYTWKYDELKNILTADEFAHIEEIFQVTQKGNYEGGRTVFHVPDDRDIPTIVDPRYAAVRAKLLAVRARRKHPRMDDKIMTDWNGLMIAAMANAGRVLNDENYRSAARHAANFIRRRLLDSDGRLIHQCRDDVRLRPPANTDAGRPDGGGESAPHALLDDYAFLIHGLIELHQADEDPAWLSWALDLQRLQDDLFWDSDGDAYFFDDGRDPTLIARAKIWEDMTLPSGNSIAARNLLRLSVFTHGEEFRRRADQILRAAAGILSRSPAGSPQMLIALDEASG